MANQVPVCWSLDISWTSLYVLVHLSVHVLNSALCKIWIAPDLPECNYCINQGVCVIPISFFTLYFKQFVISSNIFQYHLELQKYWEYLAWNSEVCCYVYKGPKMDPILTLSTFPSPTTLLLTHHTSRNSLPLVMSELIMENSVDYNNIYLTCTAKLLISALS